MTIECNDCIYRNNWNEQSKYPDCNLDNNSSECKDYKTRQQFESEEIPEWLKTEIEKIQSDYLNWDYRDWEYAIYSNSEQFGLMKGEINNILNRILSLKKPEE